MLFGIIEVVVGWSVAFVCMVGMLHSAKSADGHQRQKSVATSLNDTSGAEQAVATILDHHDSQILNYRRIFLISLLGFVTGLVAIVVGCLTIF